MGRWGSYKYWGSGGASQVLPLQEGVEEKVLIKRAEGGHKKVWGSSNNDVFAMLKGCENVHPLKGVMMNSFILFRG